MRRIKPCVNPVHGKGSNTIYLSDGEMGANMFSIAVCDSDNNDREILRSMAEDWISEHGSIVSSLTVFDESEKLIKKLEAGTRYDLYLTEAKQEKTDGIALAEYIRTLDEEALIVFVTGSDEYALRAYELHVLRYISKPAKSEEVRSALDFAYHLFLGKPAFTVFIKGTGMVVPLSVDDIMFVENNIRVMTYNLSNGETIQGTRRNISFEQAMEPLMVSPSFIQTHKSYFVNMRFISALKSDSVVMTNGREIPISRKNLSNVRKEYMAFMRRRK